MNTLVWTVGHWLYENNFIRRVISPVVNLFKPDFVMIGNNKMYIDKDDRVVSLSLILNGVWEEYETELFKRNLRLGDTVIDVGANIGYHTLIAAEIVGNNGQVYAFEPDPKNFGILKRNVEVNGYKNVTLVNKALSNKNGVGKLFLSEEDNHGDFRIFGSDDDRKSVDIELIKLDSFFGSRIPKINVIKMDVQGAEALVFKGASRTLKSNKRLKVFTEFWPRALRQSGSSAKEYSDVLVKNRFKIYEIDSLEKRTAKVPFQKLFEKYPEDSLYNADLFCVKD